MTLFCGHEYKVIFTLKNIESPQVVSSCQNRSLNTFTNHCFTALSSSMWLNESDDKMLETWNKLVMDDTLYENCPPQDFYGVVYFIGHFC